MKRYATITVIGKDKTGVIARITSFLFERKANIEALEEQVTRGQFSMTLQASWKSAELRKAEVEAGLEILANTLGMDISLRFTEPNRRQRVAILVTKETHCLEALMQAFDSGKLKVDPAVILSNRSDLRQLTGKRVPFETVSWDDRTKAETRALKILSDHQVDFIVLARFMKILRQLCLAVQEQDHQHPSIPVTKFSRASSLPPGLRAWSQNYWRDRPFRQHAPG